MKYIIIILLAVGGIVWFNRGWVQAHILNFFIKIRSKRTKNDIVSVAEKTAVFSPVGTTRTFEVFIEITEQGNGQVDITIARPKKSAIIVE